MSVINSLSGAARIVAKVLLALGLLAANQVNAAGWPCEFLK